jgi:hypothetical protein
MNNSDTPAAPIGPYQYVNEDGSFVNGGASGLTKREHFAGLAMQGLLAGGYCIDDPKNRLNDVPSEAYNLADALLKALEGDV